MAAPSLMSSLLGLLFQRSSEYKHVPKAIEYYANGTYNRHGCHRDLYHELAGFGAICGIFDLMPERQSSSYSQSYLSSMVSYIPFSSWVLGGRAETDAGARATGEYRVRQYLGIPFAEKPVRFASPEPKVPFEGVYQAKHFKEGCPQFHYYTSEDCLFLNVFAPSKERLAKHKDGKVPVLFWIFGGE